MITQTNRFQKQFGQIAVGIIISIPMVIFNAQSSLAIPLKNILDILGRNAVDGILRGSSTQRLPANQPYINPPNNVTGIPGIGDNSPAGYPSILTPNYDQSGYPNNPVQNYPQPNYQQPPYQQPPYQQSPYPNYPQSSYQQPTYPNYSQPPYQQPTYPNYPQPPYQQPTYPNYPQPPYQQPIYLQPVYPNYPPARSSPPVIINNF